jgi:small neutral amino acid transporter SnatA (MarC family)
VLVLAERIQKVLGERFVVAVERLMGLILVAVAVEMLLRGLKQFIAQLPGG